MWIYFILNAVPLSIQPILCQYHTVLIHVTSSHFFIRQGKSSNLTLGIVDPLDFHKILGAHLSLSINKKKPAGNFIGIVLKMD